MITCIGVPDLNYRFLIIIIYRGVPFLIYRHNCFCFLDWHFLFQNKNMGSTVVFFCPWRLTWFSSSLFKTDRPVLLLPKEHERGCCPHHFMPSSWSRGTLEILKGRKPSAQKGSNLQAHPPTVPLLSSDRGTVPDSYRMGEWGSEDGATRQWTLAESESVLITTEQAQKVPCPNIFPLPRPCSVFQESWAH
jgi:hypothetical protein